jgi:CTP synthase
MLTEEVVIGIVGKYTGLQDSYLSVLKSLKHASIEAGLHLVIEWIESTDLEPNMRSQDPAKYDSAWRRLKMVNGVLCPGGFGDRGIEGKALSAKYCRESNTPYFGICLGLQTAVIDFARSELGWEDANSTEFNESSKHPVVIFMPEVSATAMGGTMRLGNRVTIIKDPDSLAGRVYNRQPVVYERHRHRYEVNPQMVAALESKGLKFSGTDERGQRMEIIELESHPFFLATQFHPEFKSRPMVPSPPFLAFLLASGGKLKERFENDGGGLKVGSGWDRDVP